MNFRFGKIDISAVCHSLCIHMGNDHFIKYSFTEPFSNYSFQITCLGSHIDPILQIEPGSKFLYTLNKKISSNFNEHILCSNSAHAHSIVSLISGIAVILSIGIQNDRCNVYLHSQKKQLTPQYIII